MYKQPIQRILEKRKVRLLLTVALAPFEALLITFFGLFDYEWYGRQYCGGRTERVRSRFPLLHYIVFGRKKGLTPNPFFIGGYYDKHRWQHSIVDPLTKYIVRRRTWGLSTSPIFDGKSFGIVSKTRPPLSSYMRQLRQNGDVDMHYDSNIVAEKAGTKWSDIRGRVSGGIAVRTEQHRQREVADPVDTFAREREQETILKFANYYEHKPQPLVSIIMPAWNRESLIQQAIDSVISQTYDNWELLIVDDGSTDGTPSVVQAYSKRDKRVKLFTPGHGGVCKARNHGLDEAQGEWVAFLDSDNEWESNFLNTSIAILEDSKALASYAAIEMDTNGKIRYRTTEPNPYLLETGNFIDLNALIVKKSTLDKVGYFDPSLRRMVDYDLIARISKQVDYIYIPIIGVKYTNHEDLARISTTESVSWDGVVKSKNFIDWSHAAAKKGLTSIIVPVRGDVHLGVDCVNSILKTVQGMNVEIIIADASSSSALNIAMNEMSLFDERIKYSRELAVRDVVLAANYAASKALGETIVIVGQHVVVEPGWLQPLLDNVDEQTIVGPVQIYPSRVVASAGVEFQSSDVRPLNVLEGHPLSDLGPLGDSIAVDALTNGCFAIHPGTFTSLRGLNPLYDKGFEVQDLCLRARESNVTCVIAKRSVVVNTNVEIGRSIAGLKRYAVDWQGSIHARQSKIWKQAGFRVVKYEPVDSDDGGKILRPVLKPIKRKGQYRWAIKISSPADERRHIWGDTHYAVALAKSLTKLGQRVAIDYHDYHDRPTSYLDDVVLDLRGLDDTQPQPGALNIMWVISHPEKVTPEIVNKFDAVYAAGKKWADYMSGQSNKKVEYLPQCTDPEVFHPTESDAQFTGKVIFLGNSRNVLRPSVRDAIAAGIEIDVYGGGWRGLIDSRYIKGTFMPNDRLAYMYSSASVVLNDHWDDMREWGFISNRIFDVLASGGVVVTDDVEGLGDIDAEDNIEIYDGSVEGIKEAVSHHHSVLPDGKRKNQKAVEYIKKYYSFDARAKRLLEQVESVARG